jgi:hypothetical protein
VAIPLSGHISDLIGRKRINLIGAVTMEIWAFVYYALLNSLIAAVIFIAILLAGAARHDVRLSGRFDRRMLQPVCATRLRARLPSGLDRRRRAGADHRQGAVRLDRLPYAIATYIRAKALVRVIRSSHRHVTMRAPDRMSSLLWRCGPSRLRGLSGRRRRPGRQ